MKNFKKVLAVILAAAMTLGSTVAVFADDPKASDTQEASGSGTGYADADELRFELPTTFSADTYNFKIDPQKLLYKALNGATSVSGNEKILEAYAGKTIDPTATLLFANVSGNSVNRYSNTSDAFTVKNMGFSAITVSMEVKAKSGLGSSETVKLTDDSTFNGGKDKTTSVYLALTNGGTNPGDVVALKDSSSAKIEATITGNDVASALIEVGGTAAKPTFTYKLPDDATPASQSFYLTGASNANANWKTAITATPKVDVTYTVRSAGTSELGGVVVSGSDIYVRVVLGSNAEIGKVTAVTVNGVDKKASTRVDSSSGKLVISGAAPASGSVPVTVVYDGTTYAGTATKG